VIAQLLLQRMIRHGLTEQLLARRQP